MRTPNLTAALHTATEMRAQRATFARYVRAEYGDSGLRPRTANRLRSAELTADVHARGALSRELFALATAPRPRDWAALIDRLAQAMRTVRAYQGAGMRVLNAGDGREGHLELLSADVRGWHETLKRLKAAHSEAQRAARAGQPLPS